MSIEYLVRDMRALHIVKYHVYTQSKGVKLNGHMKSIYTYK